MRFLDELRAYLERPLSPGSHAKDVELDNLRLHPIHEAPRELTVPRYALELRAVRRAGDDQVRTPIGKLILELPDKDAVRWLLAAEVVQSRGPRDEWRISSDAAANAANTFSFNVNLETCLTDTQSGTPFTWNAGETVFLDLQMLDDQGDNAAQKFCITRATM